jgi:GntR family transcriptional regulator
LIKKTIECIGVSEMIDRNNPLPYYVQLKESIRERIERGDWKPGDLLPSEAQLCEQFDVSRTVVRQALKDLTHEGLLYSRKGKGSFVAEQKISERFIQQLMGFHQEMSERGLKPTSKVLKQEKVAATPKVAAQLALCPGAPVIEISRLRFIMDEPVAIVTTYLPYDICPRLLEEDLAHQSLYECLERLGGLKIASGRRLIGAALASEYEADLLLVEKGAPLIVLDSVSYLEDGTPIEYYRAFHRGDRTNLEVELVRVNEDRKYSTYSAAGRRQDSIVDDDHKTNLPG